MRNKVAAVPAIVAAVLFGFVTSAYAAADSAVVTLATDAGTSIKDTALGVITALAPFAVAVFLALMAIPWAKRLVAGRGR